MSWGPIVKALTVLGLVGFSACEDQRSNEIVREKRPLDRAFWVWNRTTPLSEEELAQLKAAKVETIYWQIGELEIREGHLASKAKWPLPAFAAGIKFIPVIRLESSIADPSRIDPGDLARWAKEAGVGDALQFDYDCPDRLLSSYAELLRGFRAAYGSIHLSMTALGAWCESSEWHRIESAVDAVYPMFYDVLPEQKQDAQKPEQARALVDSAYLIDLIRKWDGVTSIPWRAGLPNFTRLSIFQEGKPRGHIRSWVMADLLLNPSLSYEGSSAPGVMLFKVNAAAQIGQVSLQADDWLCLRNCDRGALRLLIEAVDKSSAAGVIWFQLPREGLASNGWSLVELGNRFAGKPELKVTLKEGHLVLRNKGNGDLAPNFEQGNELRLSWSRPILREFIAGDFMKVEYSQNGRAVPAVAALELKLRFSGLAAGQSLISGLALFREDVKTLAVKYQIDDDDWEPLMIDQ